MTKPIYKNLTRTELKNYLRQHRTDEEGWSVFFEKLSEENQTAEFLPPPWEMNPDSFNAILQEKIDNLEEN